MSALEGEAATAIRDIADSKALEVTGEQKLAICWLVGLQIRRNRFQLGYIASEVRKQSMDHMSDKDFQTGMLVAALFSFLEGWKNRNNPLARPKEKWNPFAGYVHEFRWDIVRYQKPSLVVSDTFAAQSGIRHEIRKDYSPTHQRWGQHGFIVPLGKCERITIPLSPTVGLYLHRSEDRKRLKADDFNRYTVYSSRDFVAHHVDWNSSNAHLYKLMTEHLWMQRILRQTMPDSF